MKTLTEVENINWKILGQFSIFLLTVTIFTFVHQQGYIKATSHEEKFIIKSHITSKDIIKDLKQLKILVISLPRYDKCKYFIIIMHLFYKNYIYLLSII